MRAESFTCTNAQKVNGRQCQLTRLLPLLYTLQRTRAHSDACMHVRTRNYTTHMFYPQTCVPDHSHAQSWHAQMRRKCLRVNADHAGSAGPRLLVRRGLGCTCTQTHKAQVHIPLHIIMTHPSMPCQPTLSIHSRYGIASISMISSYISGWNDRCLRPAEMPVKLDREPLTTMISSERESIFLMCSLNMHTSTSSQY